MSTHEKHQFQAEIAQLLDIVIHSLYTDKEIFVRELISNAADASEKLKFLQTSGTEVVDPDAPLGITIVTDEAAKTIAFTDAGTNFGLAAAISTVIFFLVALLAVVNLRFTRSNEASTR